ncbi:signal peptidase I [Ancylothrix sp. C2]|uniref:signal peptidase I n=1 Tax=Ancylothrix sp. D3o TaxID=2953691 RepID=UPI0021BAFFF3|nr:signal peptidase I [Ancylothrix sp. D3o]MCT7951471.1 signal peptidase I [Ancylothrix sp. D3o]
MQTIYQPASSRIKEPWLAVNLSLVLPGSGQIYAGKILKGSVILISLTSLIAFSVWSIFAARGNTLLGMAGLGAGVGGYLWNLVDAYHCISGKKRGQNATPYPKKVKSKSSPKDPWLAVFLSQILPGLGHLYLEKAVMAGILLSGIVLFANLAVFYRQLLLVPPVLYALASYHSYLIVDRKPRHYKHLIIFFVVLVLILRIITTYLPAWIESKVQKFSIPSDSMLPTLQIGDGIFVDKSSNFIPQKGDLIVFQAPKAAQNKDVPADTLFIKRTIGKPGEVIEIKKGIVSLNSIPLDEPYIAAPPLYEWGPEVIPSGFYFVLGDNRNDSFDSHVWGYLPASNIIGKAYKIYWPPAHIKPL